MVYYFEADVVVARFFEFDNRVALTDDAVDDSTFEYLPVFAVIAFGSDAPFVNKVFGWAVGIETASGVEVNGGWLVGFGYFVFDDGDGWFGFENETKWRGLAGAGLADDAEIDDVNAGFFEFVGEIGAATIGGEVEGLASFRSNAPLVATDTATDGCGLFGGETNWGVNKEFATRRDIDAAGDIADVESENFAIDLVEGIGYFERDEVSAGDVVSFSYRVQVSSFLNVTIPEIPAVIFNIVDVSIEAKSGFGFFESNGNEILVDFENAIVVVFDDFDIFVTKGHIHINLCGWWIDFDC